MISNILQVLIFIPASVIILCALFLVRKNKYKGCPKSKEVKERQIFSFKGDVLVDYNKIDDTFVEKLAPNENDENCLNLVKVNYLNLLNNKDLRNEAEVSIKKYGVGSCGPRGFYGTIDIHLTLEKRLAEFMKMEEAVLYSYGFSTISSAIAAYCKRSDIIFCDDKISFCTTQGMLAAKSQVVYFKHNDTCDLESKLKEFEEKENQSKKLFRKFLIVEAIYKATGKLCPLPKLMELREKYKLRIFIDESISFGVLGKTGRGITEHFDVNRSDVDMIMASMEGAIGSVAGFCAGSSFIIDHQRLSGIGYVFSASLPPFLSHTAICALEIFENNQSLFKNLHSISVNIHKRLSGIDWCLVISDEVSPLKVISIQSAKNSFENMMSIYNYCIERKLFVVLAENQIQFHVSISMNEDDIDKLILILQDAYRQCSFGS